MASKAISGGSVKLANDQRVVVHVSLAHRFADVAGARHSLHQFIKSDLCPVFAYFLYITVKPTAGNNSVLHHHVLDERDESCECRVYLSYKHPRLCKSAILWANGSFDKKRGRHDNERTELRLRDLGKIL